MWFRTLPCVHADIDVAINEFWWNFPRRRPPILSLFGLSLVSGDMGVVQLSCH